MDENKNRQDTFNWAQSLMGKFKSYSAHDVFDDMNDRLKSIKTFYAEEAPKDSSGMVLTLQDAELLAYEYARRLIEANNMVSITPNEKKVIDAMLSVGVDSDYFSDTRPKGMSEKQCQDAVNSVMHKINSSS